MSPSSGALVPTTVLGFLDRRPAATGEYLHVHLASGHRLRLSASHVTFTRGRPEGVFAEEVRVGDELLREAGNGTAVYSAVRAVTYHIMTGNTRRGVRAEVLTSIRGTFVNLHDDVYHQSNLKLINLKAFIIKSSSNPFDVGLASLFIELIFIFWTI